MLREGKREIEREREGEGEGGRGRGEREKRERILMKNGHSLWLPEFSERKFWHTT